MSKLLLSALLSLQLMCTPAPSIIDVPTDSQVVPLWWGLIDPELSLWFSRLPLEETDDKPILWDFSWRGFLAALFGTPIMPEEVTNASLA